MTIASMLPAVAAVGSLNSVIVNRRHGSGPSRSAAAFGRVAADDTGAASLQLSITPMVASMGSAAMSIQALPINAPAVSYARSRVACWATAHAARQTRTTLTSALLRASTS